jgi:hypothetical protein
MIAWLILVYDRAAEQRFPLKRKWYRFSYARATEEETNDVIHLCMTQKRESLSDSDAEIGTTRVSYKLGADGTDTRILRYRHLFDYVPDEKQAFSKDECRGGFTTVSLSPESYFEDENQTPIALVRIYDEEAKRRGGDGAFAIVLDQPESILRCGPVQPIRPELWQEADADLMMHLFEVYRQLFHSRWLKSECVVSPGAKGTSQVVLPMREDCMAVILPVRQLYSNDASDDLFNRCCKIHARHCPTSHPMHQWVEQYKKRFNACLEAPVGFPLNGCTLPARRYLDAFAYGAKVVHVTSKTSTPPEDWDYLLRTFPKGMVIMGYHYILRTLLHSVSMAATVLWQSVGHWISECGWAGSKPKGTSNPFGA